MEEPGKQCGHNLPHCFFNLQESSICIEFLKDFDAVNQPPIFCYKFQEKRAEIALDTGRMATNLKKCLIVAPKAETRTNTIP